MGTVQTMKKNQCFELWRARRGRRTEIYHTNKFVKPRNLIIIKRMQLNICNVFFTFRNVRSDGFFFSEFFEGNKRT